MNQLVVHSTLEKEGKNLYSNIPIYRDLATLMEHPEFRSIYNKYFTNWFMLQSVLLYMKIYTYIEKYCKEYLTPYQKIALVRKIIHNPKLRAILVSELRKDKPKKILQ